MSGNKIQPQKTSIADSLLLDSNNGGGKENNGRSEDTSPTSVVATTIDDRIRARARERELNLERAKAARKDPRDERVAIADALYSYACHVLRRKQSRGRTSKPSLSATASSSPRFSGRTKATAPNSTKCIVTFKEIVQKGLPNRSRKEITRILLDIARVLSSVSSNSSGDASTLVSPKFLKWKDPKTGEAYGVPISKNASITIDTSDFKKVREILSRKRVSNVTVANDEKE
jgi:hypothetical protein